MRKMSWTIVAVCVLALSAGLVFAQIAPRVVANVPFPFYVGNTMLPAGHYEVYPSNDSAMDLVVRNVDTGKSVFMPVETRDLATLTSKSQLVFKKVNDKTYLTEIRPQMSDGFVTRLPHEKAANGAIPAAGE